MQAKLYCIVSIIPHAIKSAEQRSFCILGTNMYNTLQTIQNSRSIPLLKTALVSLISNLTQLKIS